MAQKKKQEPVEATKVTRIKAADTRAASSKKPAATKAAPTSAKATDKTTKKNTPTQAKRNPFMAIGGYFKGAWTELRQVRWPSRRTTWGLTLAVILFTAFFVVMIVLLDLGFQWLFDQVLG